MVRIMHGTARFVATHRMHGWTGFSCSNLLYSPHSIFSDPHCELVPMTASSRPPLDSATLALLLLPPVLWASNAIVGRYVVGSIGPLTLNAVRWLLAGLILLPFAWRPMVRHRAVICASWRGIALMAFFGISCFNALQYQALQTSTVLNITLIASSGPVFILVIGAWFFKERMRPTQMFGAALSLSGVMWVILRGDLTQLAHVGATPGDLFMLVGTICWSCYTWMLRKHRPLGLPMAALLWPQILFGLILAAPFTLLEIWLGHTPTQWTERSAWIFLYVALFPALLAYFCWDRAVAQVGAQLPVFFANLTPVFAALMSIAWLGETLYVYHGVGMALILLGIRFASR